MTDTRPVLFVFVGLPCSGKTTYRNRLIDVGSPGTEYTVISRDDYVEQHAKLNNITYSQAFAEISQMPEHAAHDGPQLRFHHALERRENIIVDMTNLTVRSREKWKAASQGYGYQCVAIVFDDVDFNEIIIRNNKRAAEGKEIPYDVLLRMVKSYEELCFGTGDMWFDDIVYMSAEPKD